MALAFRLRHLGYGAAAGISNLVLAVVLSASAAAAEPVTIAALGDSLTAGYGLPQGQGFVPQLQAWLDDRGADAVIVNAGVSGDTTAGGLSRVDWTLTPDVDGLIVGLGGNDYLRGIDPGVSAANLRGILTAAQAADVPVLLVGIDAGGNYGPDYEAAFDGMYVDLSRNFDVPLYPDFFGGLLASAGTQDDVRLFMQGDGIHPNSDGVALIVADIGPVVLNLVTAVRD